MLHTVNVLVRWKQITKKIMQKGTKVKNLLHEQERKRAF